MKCLLVGSIDRVVLIFEFVVNCSCVQPIFRFKGNFLRFKICFDVCIVKLSATYLCTMQPHRVRPRLYLT